MKQKNLLIIVLTTLLILLVPLVAMQFTNQVNWKISDFAVMAFLLLCLGFSFEIISNKVSIIWHKVAIAVVLFLLFLIIWIELAVGIF